MDDAGGAAVTQECSQCKKQLPLSEYPVRTTSLEPFAVCYHHDWYWTPERRLGWAPDGMVDPEDIERALKDDGDDTGRWVINTACAVASTELVRRHLVQRITTAGQYTIANTTSKRNRPPKNAAKAKKAPGPLFPSNTYELTHASKAPRRLVVTVPRVSHFYIVLEDPEVAGAVVVDQPGPSAAAKGKQKAAPKKQKAVATVAAGMSADGQPPRKKAKRSPKAAARDKDSLASILVDGSDASTSQHQLDLGDLSTAAALLEPSTSQQQQDEYSLPPVPTSSYQEQGLVPFRRNGASSSLSSRAHDIFGSPPKYLSGPSDDFSFLAFNSGGPSFSFPPFMGTSNPFQDYTSPSTFTFPPPPSSPTSNARAEPLLTPRGKNTVPPSPSLTSMLRGAIREADGAAAAAMEVGRKAREPTPTPGGAGNTAGSGEKSQDQDGEESEEDGMEYSDDGGETLYSDEDEDDDEEEEVDDEVYSDVEEDEEEEHAAEEPKLQAGVLPSKATTVEQQQQPNGTATAATAATGQTASEDKSAPTAVGKASSVRGSDSQTLNGDDSDEDEEEDDDSEDDEDDEDEDEAAWLTRFVASQLGLPKSKRRQGSNGRATASPAPSEMASVAGSRA